MPFYPCHGSLPSFFLLLLSLLFNNIGGDPFVTIKASNKENRLCCFIRAMGAYPGPNQPTWLIVCDWEAKLLHYETICKKKLYKIFVSQKHYTILFTQLFLCFTHAELSQAKPETWLIVLNLTSANTTLYYCTFILNLFKFNKNMKSICDKLNPHGCLLILNKLQWSKVLDYYDHILFGKLFLMFYIYASTVNSPGLLWLYTFWQTFSNVLYLGKHS